jgi:hydroxymethylbilane synthase
VLRIATRRSSLARAQAFQTGQLITARTGADFELVPMATTGDRHPDRAIGAFDSKGLFVDAIRQAVVDGDCDIAVHSFKDLPTDGPDELTLGAVPPRADPRDVLVTRDGYALSTLPGIATVGTSSERRRLQLLRSKPGLQVLPVRGNLDTRLRKVADGEFDAVVVAFAGLRRLYAPEHAGGVGTLDLPLKAAPLEPGECLSAPAQGALAIECRADNTDALAVCHQVDDLAAHRCVDAERAFLSRLGGGCLAPVGALCTLTGVGGLELAGMMADPTARRVLRASHQGPFDGAAQLGADLADRMIAGGGAAILDGIDRARERQSQAGEAAS